MTSEKIALLRLDRQGLQTAPFATPESVVLWLGAMQAQDYGVARWSIAQRCVDPTAAAVDDAIARGHILRTHVLRPTWHFVHRDDIRWLLDLTAPRVHAMAAYRRRQLGIDDASRSRSIAVLAAALVGGRHLTRRELATVLERSGVVTEGQIIAYLIMDAELEGVICSGVPRGKQQTYALLDERAPHSTWLPRDEALAELTSRYFRSRGPATLIDFRWWSSLGLDDIRRGIDILGSELATFDSDGRTYWLDTAHDISALPALDAPPVVHLVQSFDEYLVAYSDTRFVSDTARVLPKGQSLVRAVLLDGQVIGQWRRLAGRHAVMELELHRSLDTAERVALDRAVQEYERFVDVG